MADPISASAIIKSVSGDKPLRPAERPIKSAATTFANIEDSIKFTVNFLAAQNPPFQGGKLVSTEDGRDTIVWEFFATEPVRSEVVEHGPNGSRLLFIALVHTVYYFDAYRKLYYRVYERHQRNGLRPKGDYKRMNPHQAPILLQKQLLLSLVEMRKTISDQLTLVGSR